MFSESEMERVDTERTIQRSEMSRAETHIETKHCKMFSSILLL